MFALSWARNTSWSTMSQQSKPRAFLEHGIATMWTGTINATRCRNNANGRHFLGNDLVSHYCEVTLDTTVALVIPLVALLTSTPATWRDEHLSSPPSTLCFLSTVLSNRVNSAAVQTARGSISTAPEKSWIIQSDLTVCWLYLNSINIVHLLPVII
jgi:hypothetical protein